jgi:hypothetical protein
MPQVLITRQTVAQRKQVRPGAVLEVGHSEARTLISAGKGQIYTGKGNEPRARTRRASQSKNRSPA